MFKSYFNTSRTTGQSYLHPAGQISSCATQRPLQDFPLHQPYTTKVWAQPEFIWFLCCINFWCQGVLFSCSPPLTHVAHATVASLKLFFLKSWMTPLLSSSQKVWIFLVWWLLVLAWHGMHWLPVNWRIYSGANSQYKWTSRKQKKLKGVKQTEKAKETSWKARVENLNTWGI